MSWYSPSNKQRQLATWRSSFFRTLRSSCTTLFKIMTPCGNSVAIWAFTAVYKGQLVHFWINFRVWCKTSLPSPLCKKANEVKIAVWGNWSLMQIFFHWARYPCTCPFNKRINHTGNHKLTINLDILSMQTYFNTCVKYILISLPWDHAQGTFTALIWLLLFLVYYWHVQNLERNLSSIHLHLHVFLNICYLYKKNFFCFPSSVALNILRERNQKRKYKIFLAMIKVFISSWT